MIILVISTGRAGSSVVAKILHNNLLISMGNSFRKSDANNPNGYWEDLEFKNLNELFIRGRITFVEFNVKLKQLIKFRNNTYNDWGIKDPRLCYLWGNYLKIIPNSRLIIVERNFNDVITSCQKCYDWSHKKAKKIINDRINYIQFLKRLNPLIINMDAKKKDKEIETIIKEWLYE